MVVLVLLMEEEEESEVDRDEVQEVELVRNKQ